MRIALLHVPLVALLLVVPAARAAEKGLMERVDDAIDAGSEWLAMRQIEDGSWPGYETAYPMGPTALAIFTLRTCDFPKSSTVIKRGFKILRRRYLELKKTNRLKTYSIALTMLALEEHHAEPGRPPARDSRYGQQHRERRVQLPPGDHAWMREMTKWMLSHENNGVWRYPERGYDHSNTQYALLALKAARRCGIPVSPSVFLDCLRHFVITQARTGPEVESVVYETKGSDARTRYARKVKARARGWGYTAGDRATGSMTTGAIGCLAICLSELQGRALFDKRDAQSGERAIRDGLAWLGLNFSVERNPGRGRWHYYYLYGLERAGILCDVKKMGTHDWYVEGATYLVRRQYENGSWDSRGPERKEGAITNTCFALLFLKRGTVPVNLPAVTPR